MAAGPQFGRGFLICQMKKVTRKRRTGRVGEIEDNGAVFKVDGWFGPFVKKPLPGEREGQEKEEEGEQDGRLLLVVFLFVNGSHILSLYIGFRLF